MSSVAAASSVVGAGVDLAGVGVEAAELVDALARRVGLGVVERRLIDLGEVEVGVFQFVEERP